MIRLTVTLRRWAVSLFIRIEIITTGDEDMSEEFMAWANEIFDDVEVTVCWSEKKPGGDKPPGCDRKEPK